MKITFKHLKRKEEKRKFKKIFTLKISRRAKIIKNKFEEKKSCKVINYNEHFYLLKNGFLRINDAEMDIMTA